MFVIPLVGSSNGRRTVGPRLASLSGFVMTLLYVGLAVFPIVAVRTLAAAKIGGVVIALEFGGQLYFRQAENRRAQQSI